jgi:prepilin-type N-terminal cleavage/methylation domain-containing protein
MTHDFRYPRRRAFTLTEILVVIAIIAILAALASWAVFAMVGNQKANNTTATIKVVNKVLQSHWQYVIEEAKKDENISPAVIALANNGNAGLDPNGVRAKVLWIKFRLMEAFPQSYTDITSPIPYSIDPFTNQPYIPVGQQRYIAAYQKSIPSPIPASHNAATESAACLLMALSINRGGIVLTQDQLGFAVADTDNDGVKELVDAWSPRSPLVPMKFTRFDTSALVQATNPAAAGAKNKAFADPNDPDGTLLNNAWYNSATAYGGATNARTYFENLGGGNYTIALTPPSPNAVGAANYVIPSIWSAGKDGIFGNQDDLISYQLR